MTSYNAPSHRSIVCSICGRRGCMNRHVTKPQRKERRQAVTHIAGYVPPRGSVALQFFGNVIKYG